MTSKYIPPQFWLDGFNCPHCGAYAHQEWFDRTSLSRTLDENSIQHYRGLIKNISISICSKCEAEGKTERYAIWINRNMVYPNLSTAPLPIEDMPEDVEKDFLEAREIVNKSPRAAAALLRLALEKLVTTDLKAEGQNLDKKIGYLVSKGLPEQIQKALDSVRVIGNESVHPGEIDLNDDFETAIALFDLLNIIIENTITRDNKINQIYAKLPTGKKEGIINRDKAK